MSQRHPVSRGKSNPQQQRLLFPVQICHMFPANTTHRTFPAYVLVEITSKVIHLHKQSNVRIRLT